MTDTNTSGADVLAIPRECTNCGGRSLSWDVSNRNKSGVVEGRLRTSDIDSICVLGCDDCSETLAVIPTSTAVAALIEREAALVARNAELEAQNDEILARNVALDKAIGEMETERDALAAEVKALRGLLSDTSANLLRMAGDEFSECDLIRLNHVIARINHNLERASAATGGGNG